MVGLRLINTQIWNLCIYRKSSKNLSYPVRNPTLQENTQRSNEKKNNFISGRLHASISRTLKILKSHKYISGTTHASSSNNTI